MELVIRCSVCGLKMIIEEIASSKTHAAVVMHVSPCPCSSRPTPLALDATNAAPAEADTSPDIAPAVESDTQPRG